jgi:signal transduction histidine kinase
VEGSVSPSPSQLGARLFLALAALCGAQAAWLAGAGMAVGMPPPGALSLAALAVVLSSASAAVAVAVLLKRAASLHRATSRGEPGTVPPSEAAVLDALGAPTRIALAVGIPLPLLISLDVALGGPVSSSAPAGNAPLVALSAVGAGLFSLSPAVVLTRRALSPWLAAFRVEDQAPGRERPTAPAPAAEIALPLVGAAIGCAAVAWADASGWIGNGAVALALAVSVLAMLLGRSAARAVREDALSLRRRALEEAESLPDASSGATRFEPARCRTTEVALVAAEVEQMAARHAGSAQSEEHTRVSVEDVQRRKMLFMASMSHDLRSPLNSILGFSELLTQGGSSLSRAQCDSVRTIARSGFELLRLLNDVLDMARFEAGRLAIHEEWTPSVEILTEAVRQGREVIGDRDLEIVAELQPGLPPVYVDRERIVQAVVCLFRHAARTIDRGQIRMYARVASDPRTGDRRLRVDVIDPSGGIREEDRERIFEAFRDVTSTTGRRIGGLGLGLSLSRALVRAHGGDVLIESGSGAETTFTVAIPVRGK